MSGNPVRLAVCNRTSTAAEQYELLVTIRTFEQALLDLFATGVVAGTTHTCIGQEPVAIGVLSAIDAARDIVFSNHRGHGHFLAYCGEVELLLRELMGQPGGVCGGRGGSQHLQFRNFYSNGIQGGIVPVATGMALAERRRKTEAVAVVFLGDGTFGEGVVYESFNLAALWKAPIVFVVEHNGYAQSTPSSLQIAGSVTARPAAFGIPVCERAADRVGDVLDAASAAIDAARAGGGPQCVLFHTYRLAPHSKGDDTRTADELAALRARDPLNVARALLADEAAATAAEQRARALVEAALLAANGRLGNG